MTDEVNPDPDDAVEDAVDAAPVTEEMSVEDIALLGTDEIRAALARAKECDEHADRLLRLQAELDNFRRREARDRENWRRHSIRGLVLDILEVVDNFDRALEADPGREGHAEFVRGIALVEKQLTGVLEQAGARPIEARGEPFDPALHEAVATAPSEGAANDTVLEEIRRGYTMDAVVIRPHAGLRGEESGGGYTGRGFAERRDQGRGRLMPTYDYECRECGHEFEHFQSMSSGVLRKCPSCGKLKLRRLIGSGAGIIFKGSGFYETDYKRRSMSKTAGTETNGGSKDDSSTTSSSSDNGKAGADTAEKSSGAKADEKASPKKKKD